MGSRLTTMSLVAIVLVLMPAASPALDEPDELMPGRVVIIRPGRLFKFVARPEVGTFDLPDASNDPTDQGAVLSIFETMSVANSVSFALPSTSWTGLGRPAGARGYRYRGAGSPADPCRTVLVRPKVVKASCTGSGVTLITPFSGAVAIGLFVGVDTKQYCATFGGDTIKNDTSGLKRRDAPAPSFCPFVTIGTGGTTTSTSTSTSSSNPATCGAGGGCSGSCPNAGEFCQFVPACTCGGVSFCACSATTFTTCTMPICSTTSTMP